MWFGKDVTFEDCHFGIKYSLHCIKYINKIFVFCTVFEVQRIFTSAEVHLKSKQGKTDHFPCALLGPWGRCYIDKNRLFLLQPGRDYLAGGNSLKKSTL